MTGPGHMYVLPERLTVRQLYKAAAIAALAAHYEKPYILAEKVAMIADALLAEEKPPILPDGDRSTGESTGSREIR